MNDSFLLKAYHLYDVYHEMQDFEQHIPLTNQRKQKTVEAE